MKDESPLTCNRSNLGKFPGDLFGFGMTEHALLFGKKPEISTKRMRHCRSLLRKRDFEGETSITTNLLQSVCAL